MPTDPAPRHLDSALARLLGWTVTAHESGEFVGTPPGKAGTHLPVRIPAYSSSLDAVAMAEAEVGRRGETAAGYYLHCLWREVMPPSPSPWILSSNPLPLTVETVGLLVTAGAEARARAAVQVLGTARP